MKFARGPLLPVSIALVLALAGGGALYAQLEGADRGVPPVESASTYEVTGVEVDVVGNNSEEAREEGWKQAQLKGWMALWASTNRRPQSQAPKLPESVLNQMVSGIVIEQEQIGPKRYIARLGVLFDRARSGQLLGGAAGGFTRQSQAMLHIPVMITGGSAQSFESRNEWQRAWARFRTGNSAIDYVRPVGSGIDPLLLNLNQTKRPGRGWWRMLLDQYGAADILVSEVHLKRSFPGGPAIGVFVARHGPDNRPVARFVLRAGNSASIPRMLDEGVRRLDQFYTRAFLTGALAADPSLVVEEPAVLARIAELIERQNAPREAPAVNRPAAVGPSSATGPVPVGAATSLSIEVGTPDAETIGQAELAVSRVGGVTSALTTSRSVGGTSVMRVTYVGDLEALAAGLRAQGWNAQVVGGNLIRLTR